MKKILAISFLSFFMFAAQAGVGTQNVILQKGQLEGQSIKRNVPSLLSTRVERYQAKLKGVPFVEPNELYFPSYIRIKGGSTVTESVFNEVIQHLSEIYVPVVQKLGAQLEIVGDWEDATVNAVATRDQGLWKVNVAGGIARAPKMTKNALVHIICHEIGHQIGGAPRMALYGGWPSSEGQADYWSGAKCLKRYYQKFRHEGEIHGNLPEKAKNQCQSQFTATEDREICLKVISTAVEFGKFLDTLNPKKDPISFDTPDPRIVKGTNINDYPRPQCRFDTLYSAALCTVNPQDLNSPESVEASNCNDQNRLGARPRCWYKP